MAGHLVAENAIEDYLDGVATRLTGPRASRAAILDELRDGLHEAAAAQLRRGTPCDTAVSAALDEFGPAQSTAGAFAGELATAQARRTTIGYLATGPVVGLLWLLMLQPSIPWRDGPAAIWAAVPAAPMIAIAAVAGMLTLAATGRFIRWLQLPDRHTSTGAVVVVAAAVIGDVLMLALAARTATPAAAGIATFAVAASTLRLACSVPVAARCLRGRRALTGSASRLDGLHG